MNSFSALFLASYPGALRLFLVYVAQLLHVDAIAQNVVSDLSFIYSISIVYILSQSTHLIKLIPANSMSLCASYKALYFFFSLVVSLGLCLFSLFFSWLNNPLFFIVFAIVYIFHQERRSTFIAINKLEKAVLTDMVFFVAYVLALLLYSSSNAVSSGELIIPGVYLFLFPVALIALCFFALFVKKMNSGVKALKEYKEATFNGVSNFSSGGLLLLIPYLLAPYESDLVVPAAKYVAILSMAMVFPRALLIKNYSQFSAQAQSLLPKNELNSLGRKNFQLLFLSLTVGVIFICLESYTLDERLNPLILIFISAYIFFSQISLFDANFLIFRSRAKKLLLYNVSCLCVFLIFYLMQQSVFDKLFSPLFIILMLPFLMMVRYLLIKRAVAHEYS